MSVRPRDVVPGISALYIVKDETDFLWHSIDSIYKYVDEFTFVWTPTHDELDQTERIIMHFYKRAEEDGKLFSYQNAPTREDMVGGYAGLRNEALKQCTKTHVLQLDGDEVAYDNISMVREIIKDDALAHICMMNEFMFDNKTLIDRTDPYGNPLVDTRMFLYRNKFGLEWVPTGKGGYHERLRGAISLEKWFTPHWWGDNHVRLHPDLYICHFGNTKWARVNKQKLARKIEMIEAGLATPGKVLGSKKKEFKGRLPEAFDRTPGWLQDILDKRRKREQDQGQMA